MLDPIAMWTPVVNSWNSLFLNFQMRGNNFALPRRIISTGARVLVTLAFLACHSLSQSLFAWGSPFPPNPRQKLLAGPTHARD